MRKPRIGTSGWSYQHWDRVFYSGASAEKRLPVYAQTFNTVEVNTTFYHLPSVQTVKKWALQVPVSFCFSVKASRFITHVKRLKNCEESLSRFYKKICYLKKKLGPILFQLPPSFEKNLERLKAFINLLNKKYKHVFEFRADSWFDEEVYELLKKKKIALCITDLNGHLSPIQITAGFIYVRLHGPKKAYRGRYSQKALENWRKRIDEWIKKDRKSVYIYFDNDEKGYAVLDAQKLQIL